MMTLYRESYCKHGLMESHPWTTSKPLEAGDWGLSGGYFDGECPGGSHEEVTREAISWCTTHDEAAFTETVCHVILAEICEFSTGGPDHKWWKDA